MVRETKYKGYTVYSDGRVGKKRGEGFIRPHVNKGGYKYFTPTSGPNRLHRFIWEAFNGPIPNRLTIDHIDGDKLNNRLENLQLMSHEDNIRKGHQIFDNKDLETIFYLKSLDWSNRRIAKEMDCSHTSINNVFSNKTYYTGKIWRKLN